MDNPWLGLKSYEEGDRLYGRNKEADELANIVMHSFHTIIYGKSGIGKTSLLRAGVFPTLRYEDYLPIYIRLEHDNAEGEEYYLRQIENALQENQCSCSVETGLATSSGKNIEGETWRAASSGKNVEGETWRAASLQSIFARYKFSKSRGIELTPVIVFDQFEEIFTLNDNKNSAAVERFFADLSDILNGELDGLNYRLVFCLREDYLYYMERLSESIPAFKRNRYCLQDLTHDEAMEVITLDNCNSAGVETHGRASSGMYVDVNTAEEILHKISPDNAEEYNATILSLYMSQLFDKMVKAGATTITSALVQQFGDDIISAFYFESIDGVSERSIEYLEDHLVTTGGYRHNVPLEDAVVAGVRQSELERLKSRRIINVQPRQGNVLYMEYAHDVLCPIIVSNREKRALRKKAKHLRRMVAAWVVFVLFMVGVAAGIGWQAVQIKRNNRDLEATRDSLLSSNEAANREKMEKQIANDSLLQARLFLAMTNEDLQEINEQLKGEKDNALRKNQAMMLMQSRAIAGQAEKLRDEGKLLKGVALCLRALPRDLSNPDRPISYEALDVLQSFLYTDFQYYKKILNHRKKVNGATFSADSRYIVTACDDNTAKIWDVESDRLVREFKHSKRVLCVNFSYDCSRILTAAEDSVVRVWNVTTGKQIKCFAHQDDISYAEFSRDGRFVITASDSTVRIWNVSTGSLEKSFEFRDNVRSVSFSPNGKQIAVLYGDISILSVATGNAIYSIKNRWRKTGLSYSRDGRFLMYNSDSLRVIDAMTGNRVASFKTCSSDSPASFSPEGKYVSFHIYGDSVRICDIETGKEVRTIKSYNDYCKSIEYSPNGRYLLITDKKDDVTVSLVDLNIKKSINSLKTRGVSFINPFAFSPDGKSVAVSHRNADVGCGYGYENVKTIDVYSLYSGEKIMTIETDTVVSLASYSPDGKYIVATGGDSVARVWSTLTGEKVLTLKGEKVMSAIFSPDGRYIATASADSTARLWNAKTGTLIKTYKGHIGKVYTVSFSPDGQCLATASGDKTVKIWNLQTGDLVRTIKGHRKGVTTVSYSPDGRYIATSSLDSTARIWSVSNGEQIKLLNGMANPVTAVSFNCDGSCAVTSSRLESRIWNVASGKTVWRKNVSYATFTPDGRYIVINGRQMLRFYKPQELIDRFRKIVGNYEFTEDEEIKYYLK